MDEMYYYWLHNIEGIGKKTFQKILKYMSPKELYESSRENSFPFLTEVQRENIKMSKVKWDVRREWERLQRRKIEVIGLGQESYPDKLSKIPDPAPILYYKGKKDILDKPSVAVIGARGCSNYGNLVAKELGRQLASMGIIVVSGMARGVDSICQYSCLEHGGESIGVLGSGVEVCYPPENKFLYERLQEQGALVSENLPFTKPSPGLFPLRNRIISGLADVVVVVEAREKSGSLITVDTALEQGKEVYAIPGRITDSVSKGCNRLIKQGAGIIFSMKDFLEEICPMLQMSYKNEKSILIPNLSEEERSILRALDVTYKTIEEIYNLVKKEFPAITIIHLMELILELQMKQIVKEENGYYYCNSLGLSMGNGVKKAIDNK